MVPTKIIVLDVFKIKKINMRKVRLIGFGMAVIVALLGANNVEAQISYGGTPPSFTTELPSNIDVAELAKIDVDSYRADDKDRDAMGKLYRYGVDIPVNLTTENAGTWNYLKNGDRIWRLTIKSADAQALGVYYDDFWLPEGSELYLYNKSKSQVIGSFNHLNNPPSGIFANELIQGDQVTLEYYEPKGVADNPVISICDITYAYRSTGFLNHTKTYEYNQSQACEVDVICPEGDQWRDQIRGVTRVGVKHDGQAGWCSGSMVNNTAEDCLPYYLTAEHCADGATFEELLTWTFYFNFERTNCNQTSETEPIPTTLIGATMKAKGPQSKSDFYLVLLSNYVPQSVNGYFNGWKTTNSGSATSMGIHHPAGDIKKISKCTTNLQTVGVYYWRTYWASTVSGAGVTEGGSSGSPLFDENKHIVGVLSFGQSACTAGGAGYPQSGPNYPDQYGKFSFSWASNGTNPDQRLKPWLSHDGTTPSTLDGRNNNCTDYPLMADFHVLDSIIPLGTTVKFYNTTLRDPDYNCSYNWTFEGVTGSASTFINSPTRTYNTNGAFPVTLTATSNGQTSTITKYMYVGNAGIDSKDMNQTRIYPNPASDKINIEFSDLSSQDIVVEFYNMIGTLVKAENVTYSYGSKITLDLPNVADGFYTVKINTNKQSISRKISILN